MKQIRKVYHVEFVSPIDIDGKPETHFYFGSQAAIYKRFTPEQLGISYGYLKSRYHLEEKPFSNDQCTIRLGFLFTAEKN